MKKIWGILIVGLLWCNVGFALTQQQFIDQNLKGRKLDTIEGVWITTYSKSALGITKKVVRGNVYDFYKSGSQYIEVTIRSNSFESGETVGNFSKRSENIYYGDRKMKITANRIVTTSGTINVSGNEYQVVFIYRGNRSPTYHNLRLWPEDIKSHNAKFDKKSPDE